MDEVNFLEDFLLSLENIPNDIRRNFELIRELDRQASELTIELELLEQAYIMKIKDKPNQMDEDMRTRELANITDVRGKYTVHHNVISNSTTQCSSYFH
jgi:hypothetical protein